MSTHSPFPAFRKLRAFAFDPSLATQLENFDVSEVIVNVRWERNRELEQGVERGLGPGPVGEYLEVVDVDPASGCVYAPVDLDDPALLAQNGLPPSEGNPQFHQQMVYAVGMATIQHFERALGRKILWPVQRVELEGNQQADKKGGGKPKGAAAAAKKAVGAKGITADEENPVRYETVDKLRIYPHALRESNAYYDSEKKALLFGYFPGRPRREGDLMTGGMVFTCLSHDIIAHEMTHAILDGVQPYFLEASNVDVLAFHEAFADLVALFQHFTYPEILRRQIARAKGDLGTENLLGQLAVQFGMATGERGALRSAIGGYDKSTGKWKRHIPDPDKFASTSEPHERGALLVAAVFDAFLAIYRHRTRDLLRIATEGRGILPEGDLHPDLVDRLSSEATKAARHFLTMCIRAIDYCPPVDITFGDFLRALITADFDMVPDDDLNYRVALVEAFRRWGIYPEDVRTLSVESLRWDAPDPSRKEFRPLLYALGNVLETKTSNGSNVRRWEELKTGVRLRGEAGYETRRALTRPEMTEHIQELCRAFHGSINRKTRHLVEAASGNPHQSIFGLNFLCGYQSTDRKSKSDNTFRVTNIRPVRRIQPDGRMKQDLVFHITQKRPGFIDTNEQDKENTRYLMEEAGDAPDFGGCDFKFRGGTTFIVDLETYELRYAVSKSIFSERRMNRHREFLLTGKNTTSLELYFGLMEGQRLANLHAGHDE